MAPLYLPAVPWFPWSPKRLPWPPPWLPVPGTLWPSGCLKIIPTHVSTRHHWLSTHPRGRGTNHGGLNYIFLIHIFIENYVKFQGNRTCLTLKCFNFFSFSNLCDLWMVETREVPPIGHFLYEKLFSAFICFSENSRISQCFNSTFFFILIYFFYLTYLSLF